MILDKSALLRQLNAPSEPAAGAPVARRLWGALHAARPLIGVEPEDLEDLLAACAAPRVAARLASAGASDGAEAARRAIAALDAQPPATEHALARAQALLLHLEGPPSLGLHEASAAAEAVYAAIAEDTVVVFCASVAPDAPEAVLVTLLTLSDAP